METPNVAWIQRSVEDWSLATEEALLHKRRSLEAVYAVPSTGRTFTNTIAALQYAEDIISDVQQQLDVMVSVHPDASLREAAQKLADHIDEENVKMDYDHRLWNAVREWSEHREHLEAPEQKLADDAIRDLKRMGFELSDEKFKKLKDNITALRKLQTEFEKAINDWEDGIVVSREQLVGLPERYIEGLTRDGEGYRVSLEYPEFFPFMRQADDDTLRRELASKELQKGGRENAERLTRMIELRQENAHLLGYATHAEYVAEPRMVRHATVVKEFLERIIGQLQPAARRELVDLIDTKKRLLGLSERKPIHFHEVAYWSYKLLRERYDINGEELKEYFPLRAVIDGMLSVYQDVLGITFRVVEDAKLWHADTKLYAVARDNDVIGHFVLDLHPRKGKYGHAAAFPIVLGRANADGSRVTGLMAMVCNFPKPTASNPSLMTHDEVETLFHEFGHIMHALLSGGRWQRQNGYGVTWDFVEAPSQLFEEWAWNPEVLTRISSHYETHVPMPTELQQKLISARHHMDAMYYLRQAIQALFDYRMHSDWPADELNADGLARGYRKIRLDFEAMEIPESSLFPAGWSHMADYDAGYYGYLWSKVYALDLYSRFSDNPLDPEIGSAFRRSILEPGASKLETDMVREFLGRESSDEAFLAALDISKKVDVKGK